MKEIFLLFINIFLRVSVLFGQQSFVDGSLQYLNDNNISPQNYVLNKFRNADVILLAEDHRVKENLDFPPRQVSPPVYHSPQAQRRSSVSDLLLPYSTIIFYK